MKPFLRILLASALALLVGASGARAAAVLQVTGVSAAPATVSPGQSAAFTVTFSNISLAPAGANSTANDFNGALADVAISLSSQSADPIFLGSQSVSIPQIVAGASGFVVVSFVVPTKYSQAASYYIKADASFSPTGARQTGTANLSGSVSAINVSSFGTNYSSAPTVNITGGGGSGATARAIVTGGAVIAVDVVTAGSGYSSAPTITLVGGGGSGAAAASTISASVASISSIAGGGYGSTPLVFLSGGGGGNYATASTSLSGGPVSSFSITNTGAAYSVAPGVGISGGGGSGATGTAVINAGVTSTVLTAGGTKYTTPVVNLSGGGGSGALVTATVAPSVVTVITVTAPGSGYSNSTTVSIGGAGTSATAHPVISGGVISSIVIDTNGSGYTTGATVTITDPSVTPGTGATATAQVGGIITGLTIAAGGSNYTSAPTVSITDSAGTGSGATATVGIGGTLTGITVTAGGSGYTSSPTVTITNDPADTNGNSGAAVANISSGTGGIAVNNGGSNYTVPPLVTVSGGGPVSSGNGGITQSSITSVSPTFTISGKPDFVITGINYAASVAYKGGDVIPMSLTYTNQQSNNGTENVPFRPGFGGSTYFRVQVVISSNPTYGDADDFLLTYLDVPAKVDADGGARTVSWNQLLPGNFSGSYYVLAKIDSLNQVDESVEASGTQNGNNTWLDVAGTRIALLPTTFSTMYLASVSTGNVSGNGYSDNPSITADGRFTVFASDASNLIAASAVGGADTNNVRDIFIYDSQTSTTRRLNLSQQGAQANAASNTPAISPNGRYVAFSSDATNLILTDNNGFSDIFVVDVITGAISLESVATNPSVGVLGNQANGSSFRPSLSNDGRYLVFESSATNLVTGGTTVGVTNIYLRDRTAGTTTLISRASGVGGVAGNGSSIQAVISADGNYVAYASLANNLVPADTNGLRDVFLRDVVGNVTTRISVGPGGTQSVSGAAGGDSRAPSISQDGRYIAFSSEATNLVVGDTNNMADIFVYDRTLATTSRVSISSAGTEAIDPSGNPFLLGSINPNISATGRFVTFASLASNLAPGDYAGRYGTLAAASLTGSAVTAVNITNPGTSSGSAYYTSAPAVTISGGSGSGATATAILSNGSSGNIIGFTVTNGGAGYLSVPTVTISGTFNGALNIFVADRDVSASGTMGTTGNIATSLVSVNKFGYQTVSAIGVQSTAASDIYPVISADGRWVAMPSDAEGAVGLSTTTTNLLTNDANGARDVFLHDRRTNSLPATSAPPTVAITSPGNGSTLLVNTPISITASATAATVNGTVLGVVSSVQFYVNGASVGTSTTFPYSASWTPSAVGNYTLSALVTDSFGNLGVSSNVSVTINAAPSVGLTSPTAGTSVTVSTPVSVTASAGATTPGATITSVSFYASGVLIGNDTTAPYGVTWTPAVTGTYTLTAVALDSNGTSSTSPAVTVTVTSPGGSGGGGGGSGSAPPVVALVPTPPTTASVNARITLGATATAASGLTIANVQFLVNGAVIGSSTTAPYSVVWTPLALGTYSITAVATDNTGAFTTSTVATVNVNATLAVTLTTPLSGATIPVNTPQTVAATASFTNGTVTSVQFFANGTAIGSASAFPYSITWTPATPGTYSLTATATDNTGSTATSTASVITVATGTAPAVSISSPASGSTVPAGIQQILVANASPGSGTIANVQFFANGVSIGSSTSFPYNLNWTPAGLGPVALTAVATDSLGNQTTSVVVNVIVAPLSPGAPSISITSPSAGASLSVGIATTVTASATDPDGTISNVQFFANGVSIGIKTSYPFSTTFTPAVPGNYVLTARATDDGGNFATSSSVTVNVSGGTAPAVAITAPAGGSSFAVNTPQTINANASSASGFITSVQFFVNGVALASDTNFPYSATWNPTALGTYSLTARATDNLGNITDSAPVVVTAAASAPPIVSVTNPLNGSSYTVGTALNLSADASDPDGTITSVQFVVNGVNLGTPVTTAPYRAPWTAGSSGVYTITALATDNTNNVTISAPIIVTVGANAAPTVALTSPTAGSYALGNQILIAASASDSDGTVASVQFFANGLPVGSTLAAPFNFSWRPSASGSYRLTAIATDNAGNSTTSAPVTISVSSVAAPNANITNPVAGQSYLAGNLIPIVATTSGGNGPISQVQFFVNGASLSTDTTFPYSANWTPVAPGTYSLLAVATDAAGISSSATALLITITGNQPPTVSITSPASGTSVNAGSIVNLVAAATDVDGTVATVRFLANGNVVGTPATAAPFSTSWVPSAAGSYSITAQATDNSGNVTNSATITINVSGNLTPTISLITPATGTVVKTGNGTTLVASASDSDGTIASVQFFANGAAVGGAVTGVSPLGGYRTTWTPTAEGLYRLTAVTVDNAGASATSPTVMVLAISAASGGTDTVYTGNYSGGGELGRFAAISVRGKTATFIGYSTSTPSKTYFYSGLPLDGGGNFNLTDAGGRVVISGNVNDTGFSGALDNNRIFFIGPASFQATTSSVAAGYYTGNLTGRSGSTLAAIIGQDGSIMLYVSDGSFQAAGSGSVDGTGSFNVAVTGGARFTGKADPVTGFLTGSLSGANGGAFMAATSSGVTFSDGFLRNLSTRGQVGTGGNILIAGFVVGGSAPKQVLVRAIGPTLSSFGVTGVLADPQLQLFDSSGVLKVANNNWGGAGDVINASLAVGAFPLASGSLDAVILATLSPGAYTAQVSGVGNTTGLALVELYDVDSLQPFSTQKVMNVATRGVVGTGQAQLIAGFVVSGNTSKKVLIRGVGPTLAAAPFNVAGVLADPVLRLVRSDNLIIRENDNWETGNDVALLSDAATKVGAFPLAFGGKDSAILLNLPPGTYSAQVTGSGNTTGVALIEVYEVP